MRYDWKGIGEYIADIRKYENLTQEDFISELKNLTGLKLSRNTLSKIENGERSAFSKEIIKMGEPERIQFLSKDLSEMILNSNHAYMDIARMYAESNEKLKKQHQEDLEIISKLTKQLNHLQELHNAFLRHAENYECKHNEN